MNNTIEKHIFKEINYIVKKYLYYNKPISSYDNDVLLELKMYFKSNYEYIKKKYYPKDYLKITVLNTFTLEYCITYIVFNFDKIYGFGIEKSIYYLNEFLQNDMWKQYENQH